MNEKTEFMLLGNFDFKDAKCICDLMEKDGIEFELEIDDSAIRNMSPLQATYGGTYGSGVSANIYVPPNVFETCMAILDGTNE